MRLPSDRAAVRVAVRAAVIAALLVTTGCAFGPPDDTAQGKPPNLPPPPSPSVPANGDDSVGVQVLTKNLAVPWGLTFLPDGSALVTERDTRRILQVTPGGVATPVQTLDAASSAGEGGLMGIAASPNYAKDKTVFVYYTTTTDNRIAKLVLGGAPTPIVTGIPVSAIHNGGRLAFGPDGFLYAGTGDASQNGRSQDLKSLGGKILRMTTAGKPAPGNPFPNSLVYSYGHRNVQGLAWDDQKRLYATEFGQNKLDEVNLIQPGKNYGWPTTEGPSTNPKFTNPLVTWKPSEASPSGVAISGDAMVVACLKGERLYVLKLDGKGGVDGDPQTILQGKFGRLRTIEKAPDGSLWVTTSNRDGRGSPVPDDDRIIRILPPGSGGVSVL
ncbi:MAG: glucose sorbosone dehydrogenase [Actinomycetia bacterium]|nr:glucose sorbosone dehydrogenase [Actinomycetes bacterium]